MGSNEEYLDKLLQSVTNEEKQHETVVHEHSQDMSDDELLESLIEMYSEELADFKEAEIIHKDDNIEEPVVEVEEEPVVNEESLSLDDLLGTSFEAMSEFDSDVLNENQSMDISDLTETVEKTEPVEEYTSTAGDYLSQDDIEALLSSLQEELPQTTSEVVNSEKIIEDFSGKDDDLLEELLSEPQTIEAEDADIWIPEKNEEFDSSEENLLKEMGIESMSAEQIDELLNAAAKNEQPEQTAETNEMDMNALFGGFSFADDFDPEHKASEEMADLLGGMLGGNDDLAEINELLNQADNNVNADDSNLRNLLDTEDDFGGNDLLNELLQGDGGQTIPTEDVKEEKKPKKEKKSKVKKEKIKKDKKEGESFWKKLTSVLFEEEEELDEGKKVKITDSDELATLMNADENDAILAEMMNEDKQKGKKSKKKDSKKKNNKKNKDAGESEDGEEVIDPKEQAKQAKLKEKAEKKAAKKKAKEEKAEADRAFLKAQPSISTKRAMIAVLFAVSVLVIVLVIYIFVPVAIEKASARKAFYHKEYYEAYELLQGKELNDSDRILLNKVTCILKLQRKVDSYQNYMEMDKPLEAVNSLMEAVALYNENSNHAKALSIDAEYKAIYDEVLLILNGRYGITEDMAKEINACVSDAEYTVRLYYLIEGKAWEDVEEETNEKPMEDVLPEEEEFLEGQ